MGVILFHYLKKLSFVFLSFFFFATCIQVFHAQPKQGGAPTPPQPPAPRPKVRARRGQATDPHSIAERVGSHPLLFSASIFGLSLQYEMSLRNQ